MRHPRVDLDLAPKNFVIGPVGRNLWVGIPLSETVVSVSPLRVWNMNFLKFLVDLK